MIDWEASARHSVLAGKLLEWACTKGPFQSNVIHSRNALEVISKPYWTNEDLEAAAKEIGCTREEILAVVLAYRD